jgi:Co/Zn/Cd efflux system component
VLIADGIESAMDVGGSVVIWGGLKVAARPPDRTHPYGHGKAEPIAAVIVAIGVWLPRLAGHSKRARNLSAASWTCALHLVVLIVA